MRKGGGPTFAAKVPKVGGKKRGSAGPKMAPYFAVTKKKSEPDNPIIQPQGMPLGGPSGKPGNAGSKARSKAARTKRLTGVRL